MKRLALLTLITSPAFAHQTQFNDPAFLKLSKGDPIKAQILSWYCDAKGGNKADCISSLLGSGNMGFEAALNDQQQLLNNHISYSNTSTKPNEAPGARSHKADGFDWHTDYQREGTGRLHRHAWAEAQRKTAKNEAIRDVLVAWRNTSDATSGDATVTKSGTDSISWEGGLADFITMVGKGSISSPIELSKKLGIPESLIKEAIENGQLAYSNPSIFNANAVPVIGCYKEERDCRNVPEGENKTNDSWDPKAEQKEGDRKSTQTRR